MMRLDSIITMIGPPLGTLDTKLLAVVVDGLIIKVD